MYQPAWHGVLEDFDLQQHYYEKLEAYLIFINLKSDESNWT